MSFTTLDAIDRASISVNLNEDIDRLIVLNSCKHPDDKATKAILVKAGYLVQVMGNIYTIAGPCLDKLKLGLEDAYGVSEPTDKIK